MYPPIERNNRQSEHGTGWRLFFRLALLVQQQKVFELVQKALVFRGQQVIVPLSQEGIIVRQTEQIIRRYIVKPTNLNKEVVPRRTFFPFP